MIIAARSGSCGTCDSITCHVPYPLCPMAPSSKNSNADIARVLYIGEGTVKTHVDRILNKLNLRDRVQVVVFAYEHGLIRPGRDTT